MRKILLILFLLLTPCVLAETLFDYQSLTLEHQIKNTLYFDKTSVSYFVTKATINLSLVPFTDYRQSLDYSNLEPEGIQKNQNIEFTFNRPQQDSVSIRTEYLITTQNKYFPVNNKVDFPIANLDSSLSTYLEFQEIIDSNPEIIDLASELAEGQDNLYEVVFSIAEWIHENIDYNLTTATAEAAQKSSWVLDNRYGVCDEITSLFISMARSLGIPAKFVSGISYTDLDIFESPWGNHGWAEVYFPDIGWIPFDVTYRQLGFLDATHIKLQESLDATKSSIEYHAQGKDFKLRSGPIESKTIVKKQGNLISPVVSLDIKIQKSNVGFGSFNLATVTVKNLKPYYVIADLQLARTEGLVDIGKRKDFVLLAPYVEKKVYFITKVSDDLQKNYVYTFPVKIYSGNLVAEVEFTADRNGRIFDENFFESLIPKEDSTINSKGLLLNCSSDKSEVFTGEKVTVSCIVKNVGTETFRWLNTCLEDTCYNKNLEPNNEAKLEFVHSYEEVSVKNLVITAKNEKVSKTNYILLNVKDKPAISVINIVHPANISFEGTDSIEFSIQRDSHSQPQKIIVKLKHEFLEEKWVVSKLDQEMIFQVNFAGSNLNEGNNLFQAIVSFEDEQGNSYETKEEFLIILNDVNLWQKTVILLNQLVARIEMFINNI
jgi:hypothetical protein